MNKEEILKIGQTIILSPSVYDFLACKAEVLNFISTVAGKSNPFYTAAEQLKIQATLAPDQLRSIHIAFLRSVSNDLISNSSYERKVEISVVNDYLSQADELLEKEEFHPAAAALLIGASLEEFLRSWSKDQNLMSEVIKESIDGYANVLKKHSFIDKQDYKDITSWAGLRNNAAHGHWEKVNDRDKIIHMLSGVNLFIRKYTN